MAVVLSLTFLGAGQAFRSDEVWSLRTISLPWPATMAALRADVHPPLYYVLLRLWTTVTGTSEVGVRTLSALLHLSAGAFVFASARQRSDRSTAILCATVFLTSPLGILVAQLGRMYSLLELTAAVSLWSWLRCTDVERRSARHTALFIAANIAGTFTHIWFLFYLAALGITHLCTLGLRQARWLAAAGACSLLPFSVFWLPVVKSQVAHSADALAWLRPPSWSAPVEVALMQGGVASLIIGLALLCHRGARNRVLHEPVALLWVFAILIPFGISYVRPIFWPRFTAVALPAFSLAAGSLIGASFAPVQATGTVLSLASLFTAGQYAIRSEQCDSRWTAEWLSRNTQAEDVVLFTSLSRLPTDYYWHRVRATRPREQSYPAAIDQHPGYEGRIQVSDLTSEAAALTDGLAERRSDSRIFLLHGFNPEANAAILAALDEKYVRNSSISVRCASMPDYYRAIDVWQLSPKRRAHPVQSVAFGAAGQPRPEIP